MPIHKTLMVPQIPTFGVKRLLRHRIQRDRAMSLSICDRGGSSARPCLNCATLLMNEDLSNHTTTPHTGASLIPLETLSNARFANLPSHLTSAILNPKALATLAASKSHDIRDQELRTHRAELAKEELLRRGLEMITTTSTTPPPVLSHAVGM